ncbi:MAG: hypothetical protein KAU50_09715, partial [Candidatus Marinimicrobia bacterium]|nr:hypothetical protein [Candidatus Neomarinimicrobiota bacterium]
FSLSFALLAYEVVLLRILAYLQWYHFAYMVISLALLGFGASGTLMHIFRPFWERHFARSFEAALILTAVTMAAVKPLLAIIPTDVFIAIWQPWQLWGLIALCLVLFLPFLCGAFGIILVLSRTPGKIAVYYGANLAGSGTGALAGILLLYLWHPLAIPRILALLITVAVALFALSNQLRGRSRHQARAFPAALAPSIIGAAAVVILGWGIALNPAMSQYKALSRARQLPATDVLLEGYSPLGVADLVQGPTLRAAAGLSLSYQGTIRPQIAAFIDGNPVGVVPLLDDTSAGAPLRHTSQALAYRVRFAPDDDGNAKQVLVLNAGPGSEVHQALMHGGSSVTAVVRDGKLLDMLGHLSGIKAGSGDVYTDPRVKTVVA